MRVVTGLSVRMDRWTVFQVLAGDYFITDDITLFERLVYRWALMFWVIVWMCHCFLIHIDTFLFLCGRSESLVSFLYAPFGLVLERSHRLCCMLEVKG